MVVHYKTFCTDVRTSIVIDLMISTTKLTIILHTVMLLLLIEKKKLHFFNCSNTTEYLQTLL